MFSFIPIETERLHLRFFTLDDAPTVQKLAGAWDIARTTVNIPHPYLDGMAEQWIANHLEAMQEGAFLTLAITNKADDALMGSIAMRINKPNRWAELGYWIGTQYWNKGYVTEAVQAVIRLGFEELNLNRIQAQHLTQNPASGRVMQKNGMRYEGTLRQVVYRFDTYHDLAQYAILREEYVRSD